MNFNMVAGRLIRPPHFPPTRATAARVTSRAGTLGATRAPIGGEGPSGSAYRQPSLRPIHLDVFAWYHVWFAQRVPPFTRICTCAQHVSSAGRGTRSRVRSSWPRTQGKHHILGVHKRGERTRRNRGGESGRWRRNRGAESGGLQRGSWIPPGTDRFPLHVVQCNRPFPVTF